MPDLGFSGFRVFGDAQSGRQREVAIFQGASFFRSSAQGPEPRRDGARADAEGGRLQGRGVSAVPGLLDRAAVLAQADALVIHALLDSESVTGAYRFTLRAGDVTIIDTEVTLFPRAAVENYGIAGMTTTFLFGANDRRGVDDVRPAVHESSGLQIHNGNGEWIWRPLHQSRDAADLGLRRPRAAAASACCSASATTPSFLDDDQNFERRPSLWIEPIGDWDPGLVQLIEIPTDCEINDNVLAYWRPKQPLAAGAEVRFAYRQFWCWQPPDRPALPPSRHHAGRPWARTEPSAVSSSTSSGDDAEIERRPLRS